MYEEWESFLFKYGFVEVTEGEFINFLCYLYKKHDPMDFCSRRHNEVKFK